MSQRVRKNGSPTSSCNVTGVTAGSPTASAGISAAGVGLLGRLLPMKATVPFQLKQQTQQHPLQTRTVLSTGNGKCLSSGCDPPGTHNRSPTRSLSSGASNISPVTCTSSAPCPQCITSTVTSSSSRTSPVISVHATNPRAPHAQVPVTCASSPYPCVHVSQCCSPSLINSISDSSALLTSNLSTSPSSSSSWSCGHRAKSQQPLDHDRLSPDSQSPSSPVNRDFEEKAANTYPACMETSSITS